LVIDVDAAYFCEWHIVLPGLDAYQKDDFV